MDAFVSSLARAIGEERVERALAALADEASVSVRLNPFKLASMAPDSSAANVSESGGAEASSLFTDAEPVAWSKWGRLLRERPSFTLSPHFHSGVYYVQDSSAMFVAELFRRCLSDELLQSESLSDRQSTPLRVLDLCAAPGGKTTDLAASLRSLLGASFVLLANEIMKKRAHVLVDNVARWGDPNVFVSSLDPSVFAKLPAYFDYIVADVPCSGEGMFRKDEQAVAQWSEENVALCAARQRRIIADVWPSLKDGGVLIYSTCTFNRDENDENVKWICEELGAECLNFGHIDDSLIDCECGYSLVPGFVPGEGQYAAALRKISSEESKRNALNINAKFGGKGKKAGKDSLTEAVQKYFSIPVSARQKGDMIIATPSNLLAELDFLSSHFSLLSSGCAVGQLKGKDLVPDEDLALSIALNQDAFASYAVDEKTALAYLHKDAIVLDHAPKGLLLLTYEGVPLGFVKNLGNRCNNLHPQSRRIRMDIQ